MSKVTINKEQGLYVIECQGGYTCLGFQNALDHVIQLCNRLELGPSQFPKNQDLGTMELWNRREELLARAARTKAMEKTWYGLRTPGNVVRALERARSMQCLVRIWTGDPKTGESDLNENEIIGRVSRSMGPMKIPILVPQGESCGGSIWDEHVIRVTDLDLEEDIYCHKEFHVPILSISTNRGENCKEYEFYISKPGTPTEKGFPTARIIHSYHKTFAEACALVAFLSGVIDRPPLGGSDDSV